MPATAVQLPFVANTAARTGKALFRKQILPVGQVSHPVHGDLTFTPDRLAKLREQFLAGAMDCVPFVLVDGMNAHSDDPERARGEVRGVELTDDGLYATIETSERGTQLLRDTPNLPVSVRLKTLPDGSEVLAHVAGTHDPVAKGMRPWEAIDASQGVTVQDFSDRGTFTLPSVTTTAAPPTEPTPAPEAFTPEEVGKVRAFFARLTGSGDPPPVEPTNTPPAPTPASVTPAAVTPPADPPPAPAITATPAFALSDEDKSKLDMSHTGVLDLTARLGVSELAGKLDAYLKDGVPPALVNGARTALLGDKGLTDMSAEQKTVVIDFANGKANPATTALFGALDAAKGTIDFSEKGTTTSVDLSDDARKAEQKMCDAAAEGYR